mmetsp:Transcript_70207/g.121579  ORF Transcript_70207/g.121579 Transcript_70207/m.121579 type:complete len:216 (-) Transcript_70207:1263-1910(-)
MSSCQKECEGERYTVISVSCMITSNRCCVSKKPSKLFLIQWASPVDLVRIQSKGMVASPRPSRRNESFVPHELPRDTACTFLFTSSKSLPKASRAVMKQPAVLLLSISSESAAIGQSLLATDIAEACSRPLGRLATLLRSKSSESALVGKTRAAGDSGPGCGGASPPGGFIAGDNTGADVGPCCARAHWHNGGAWAVGHTHCVAVDGGDCEVAGG